MLACKDAQAGMPLLDRYIGHDYDLLMVSDYSLGNAAFERFGFSEKLACFQVAYYGKRPSNKSELYIRPAEERDLPILIKNYHLVNPEELEKLVRRKNILLGYHQDQLVGFIGGSVSRR
ncbi:MAG: hypothetical protein Q4A32_02645 [Lachnospiraceae bacterium]|nr:hypothetical protein [Lachnospiraceae bacterium]